MAKIFIYTTPVFTKYKKNTKLIINIQSYSTIQKGSTGITLFRKIISQDSNNDRMTNDSEVKYTHICSQIVAVVSRWVCKNNYSTVILPNFPCLAVHYFYISRGFACMTTWQWPCWMAGTIVVVQVPGGNRIPLFCHPTWSLWRGPCN